MNRRQFGKRLAIGSGAALAASALVAPGPGLAGAAEPSDRRPEPSPHVEALGLVFQKATDRIRAVDQANWWHDVQERAWVVQRPFAPGVIDSTHLFTVQYRIAGKQIAAWTVDTRRGTVDEIKPESGNP
jgi:hypothetical protein